MDNSTGKLYESREEALAAGVDPRRLVEFVSQPFTSSRKIRRKPTERQVRIANQGAAKRSDREAARKAATRRIQKQSRKANRKKK